MQRTYIVSKKSGTIGEILYLQNLFIMSTSYLETCLQMKLHVVLNFLQHVCCNVLTELIVTNFMWFQTFQTLYNNETTDKMVLTFSHFELISFTDLCLSGVGLLSCSTYKITCFILFSVTLL
jgi:hypothetical protein